MSFIERNQKSIIIAGVIALAFFGTSLLTTAAQGEALDDGRYCIVATNSDDNTISHTTGGPGCEELGYPESSDNSGNTTPEETEEPAAPTTIRFIQRADSSINILEHAGKEAHVTVTRHIEGAEDEIVCDNTRTINVQGYLNNPCVPTTHMTPEAAEDYSPSYTILWTLSTGEEWIIEVTPEQMERTMNHIGWVYYQAVFEITPEGVTQTK